MCQVLICVGRFNPPTKGHDRLFNRIREESKRLGVRSEVFIVEGEKASKDKMKNPLSGEERLALLKSWYPDIHFDLVGSAMEVMDVLEVQNKKPVAWIAGTDRIKNYQKLLEYAGHRKSKVIGLDRTDDTEISATNARRAALEKNYGRFARVMPSFLEKHELLDLMRRIADRCKVEDGIRQA